MGNRFLLDNDGSNFFAHIMTDDVDASIAEAIDACPPAVTAYLLCPNGCDFVVATPFPTTALHMPIPALRAELFVEYIPQEDQSDISRPHNRDCRFFQVPPKALQGGSNSIRLFNMSTHNLQIDRINLGLW